jgi:radical SAM protein with 4Fe4S-binding SPASM domain
MPLNAATKRNLQRKSAYVDSVQMRDKLPLFSWLDLSLTELCNRSAGHPTACKFCPRIDPAFYPNQNLHMAMSLVEKITRELQALEYKGVVVLCGYGEPLLHPQAVAIVATLKTAGCRVELVTNGDFLGAHVQGLYAAGLDYTVVSMYDGPHQVEKFKALFAAAGIGEDKYLLRDRWHSEADQFGLKLTNRGGTVTVGDQDPVDAKRPCFYTAYQLQIDWNGDTLLCPQDWYKHLKFGNLNTDTLLEVWRSKRLHKRRSQLLAGRRTESPCKTCNTDGTLHGHAHAHAWGEVTK